jgi:hypothetical protein
MLSRNSGAFVNAPDAASHPQEYAVGTAQLISRNFILMQSNFPAMKTSRQTK